MPALETIGHRPKVNVDPAAAIRLRSKPAWEEPPQATPKPATLVFNRQHRIVAEKYLPWRIMMKGKFVRDKKMIVPNRLVPVGGAM